MSLIDKIETLIKPSLTSFDVELQGVSLIMEQGRHILRVELDGKTTPLDLNTIVSISELLSSLLDDDDLIPHNYTLDVCSAGAERKLDHHRLNDYVNSYIHLHLSRPFKGLNDIEGTLIDVDDTTVTIQVKDKANIKILKIVRADIDHARRAIKF